MKYLFIDESGDHNLLKIDPQFQLFVLTGIVFESNVYEKFRRNLLKLKKQLFDTDRVVLHSKELTRPNITRQKALKDLTNPAKRNKFYTEINKLLSKFKFSILCFVIDKKWFAEKFAPTPPDPYFLSFIDLFTKFEESLGIRETGKIFVEQRNKILDKQFLLAWESAKTTKVSRSMDSKKLQNHKIEKPSIMPKSWDESGLEIADLISYRLSRAFMNKPEKPRGNEIDIKVINKKKISISSFTALPNAR